MPFFGKLGFPTALCTYACREHTLSRLDRLWCDLWCTIRQELSQQPILVSAAEAEVGAAGQTLAMLRGSKCIRCMSVPTLKT